MRVVAYLLWRTTPLMPRAKPTGREELLALFGDVEPASLASEVVGLRQLASAHTDAALIP